MSMPPPTVPIQMMMSLKLTSALINSLQHRYNTPNELQSPNMIRHHMTNTIKYSRQTCSKYLKINYKHTVAVVFIKIYVIYVGYI